MWPEVRDLMTPPSADLPAKQRVLAARRYEDARFLRDSLFPPED